jgi:hypothetical protein
VTACSIWSRRKEEQQLEGYGVIKGGKAGAEGRRSRDWREVKEELGGREWGRREENQGLEVCKDAPVFS